MANEERDENFWINACLHLIFCKREDCHKCGDIKRAVAEDKEEVLRDYEYREI
jgi:hypothetical protein